MFKTLFFCLIFSFLMTSSHAEDTGMDRGYPVYPEQETYPQGVHIYREFPVYPPGQTYFFEKSEMRSFTVRLIPPEDLENLTQEEVAAAKSKVDGAADYIETNAISSGWKLIDKKIDAASASLSYSFEKENEGEGIVRKVEVFINAGVPISLNGTFSLPEDFGKIRYEFKASTE